MRNAVEFFTGASLLATHTIVLGDMFLYHIPKYWPCEFPKLKNPASKVPAEETRVLLPWIDSFGVIIVRVPCINNVEMKKQKKKNRTIINIRVYDCFAMVTTGLQSSFNQNSFE